MGVGDPVSQLRDALEQLMKDKVSSQEASRCLGECQSIIERARGDGPDSRTTERLTVLRDALLMKSTLLDDDLAERMRDYTNNSSETLKSLQIEERSLRRKLDENIELQKELQEQFDRKIMEWTDRTEAAKVQTQQEVEAAYRDIMQAGLHENAKKQLMISHHKQMLETVTLPQLKELPVSQLRLLSDHVGVEIAPLAEKMEIVQQILETMPPERLGQMGTAMGLHMHLAAGTYLDVLRPYLNHYNAVPGTPQLPKDSQPEISSVTDRSVVITFPSLLSIPRESQVQYKVQAKLLYPLDHPMADSPPQWTEVSDCSQASTDLATDTLTTSILTLTPGATYIFRAECQTILPCTIYTAVSDRVKLPSEFIPTSEWKEVLTDIMGRSQPVPAGCHFRSDLSTGQTLAKIGP